MDVNDLRAIVTVAGLALFLVLVARTWSRRAKAGYDEAALLPLQGEIEPEGERP